MPQQWPNHEPILKKIGRSLGDAPQAKRPVLYPAYRISTGCSSLKLTALSAGRTMSLLPVKAAPAVPAPAPAAAPIAAPLPPPAKPPMSAPSPAPPPIATAERLPLPFIVRLTAAVSTL